MIAGQEPPLDNIFHRACGAACRGLLTAFFRFRAYGLHNVPARGGVLFLSNHQSFLDPILIEPPLRRTLSYMARDSLFHNPLFGAFIRALDAFPVRRGRADTAAIREAIDRLRAGRALLLFPEGTRSQHGELGPMRGGFLVLVRNAHVPVVPVALDGAHRAWPRSRPLPRPARLSVAYGEPIPPDAFDGLTDDQAALLVRSEIARLLDRLRQRPESSGISDAQSATSGRSSS